MKQLYTLRRTLSAIILLLVSAIPCMAYGFEVDGITYNINNDRATVEVAFDYYSGDIVIPSTVTYDGITYSVTSIGDYAFQYCTSLTSISIPEGMTSIGDYAFQYCTSLTSISISESVTCIGERAFDYCVSLTSISIPESVTSIGDLAFEGCYSLTSISIPEGMTSIGYLAFEGCSSLTSITVSSDNTVYDSREGCNAIIETSTNTLIAGCQSTIIPESVTSIGYGAFSGCTSLTSVSIPEGVTSIGDYAFDHCTSLTSISIPEGMTSIGYGAFQYCTSLTSISIPENVISIGYYAFLGCTSLTSITVSPDNTVYDSREGCNAIIETSINTLIAGCKSTIIPEGVTSIGTGAFYGCTSLTTISIPEGVTSIGYGAFADCTSLTSISIPKGVTSIGYMALSGCTSLTSITVSPDNTVYDSREGCNAIIETSINTLIAGCKSTIIPEGVTSIEDSAFDDCTSLTSISIPEGVTSIGDYAFAGCSSLTSISIPESVTSIGTGAFYGCFSLTTIVCRANVVPKLGDYAFSNVPQSEATLYVPSSSIEAYRVAGQWGDFGKILPLEEYEMSIASPTAVGADTGYDVYTIRGTLIRKGCNSHNLNGLPAGAYILRHGNESKTVVKR